MKVTVVQDQNLRPYMEDTFVSSRAEDSSYALFGVFDGHGGAAVADMCKQLLPERFDQVRRETQDAAEAMRRTFERLDDDADRVSPPPKNVGATALVAVIDAHQHAWVANAGDSMAVLISHDGTTVTRLSQEHKVENEKERLRAAGATITYDDGVARVFRTLNVSRSIGDHFLKPYVISEPYVAPMVSLVAGDRLVLASDGIWDVMTARDMGVILHHLTRVRAMPTPDALKMIVEMAKRRGSTDNITLMMVDV